MSTEAIQKLKSSVKGNVLLPDSPNYNDVRKVWNAMIDRRPAVIVQGAHAGDARHAIRYARDNGLDIAIRGAGHNIAGNGMCEGGMLIDHSNMKNLRVDSGKRRAYVEPGATLGDFDAAHSFTRERKT